MKKQLFMILVLYGAILNNLPLCAKNSTYAICGKMGTMGYGIEITKSIFQSVNLRGGVNVFNYNTDKLMGEEDFDVNFNLKLFSFSLLLDYYLVSGVYFTGGLVLNQNEFAIKFRTSKSYQIGELYYSPEELGKVSGMISFDKTAGYLGIGFGNPVCQQKSFGLVLDIGALFQNSPKVEMSGDGMIEPTTEQQPIIEENLEEYKIYPVISLGISYQF